MSKSCVNLFSSSNTNGGVVSFAHRGKVDAKTSIFFLAFFLINSSFIKFYTTINSFNLFYIVEGCTIYFFITSLSEFDSFHPSKDIFCQTSINTNKICNNPCHKDLNTDHKKNATKDNRLYMSIPLSNKKKQ